MSGVTFNRKRVKLKKLLGIRARLAMLAVMLVAPLMLERVRSLEDTRAKQIATASEEYANIAHHSAETQREVISSVETMLKSAAYIRAASGIGRSCEILRASLPANLPWIRSIMLVSKEGVVQCSTLNIQVGLNLGDRDYFRKAQQTRDFVFSDYLFGKTNNRPIMMAAYPVSAINPEEDSVAVAGINLDWLSKIMANLGGRPGISALLIDSTGVVLAAPPDQASMIGRPLDNVPLLSAITYKALSSNSDTGSISFTATDGSRRAISFARIPGTQSRLIVSVDEAKVTAAINREIRTAYLQLGIRLPVRAARRADRRREAHHQSDRSHDRHGQAVRRGRLVGPRRAQPSAVGVHAARPRLQRDGRPAQPARARTRRHQRPPHRDGLDRHAVGPRQPPRLPEPAGFRMDEGAAVSLRAVAADDRCRSLQALQRHLWPSGGRRLPDPDRRRRWPASPPTPWVLPAAMAARNSACCCRTPARSRALEIGETVRATVQGLGLPHITSSHCTVTVSVGVAATLPNDAQTPGDLIEAADAALYAAKHRGRNTVVEHGFAKLVDDAGMAMAG